ncbi:type II secretion system inner membrane protein GspF [Marinomonas sp. THO17]|uniref:type II secretion system inner membrane protein GspF n=1 Tax=Marinomonas sp. THO17 TaxID=3149048 RepID=UPI00336BF009
MAAYDYQALDGSGKKQKGVLEAENERHLRKRLSEKGLILLTSKESKHTQSAQLFSPKMSVKERALITRQLATLISAGFPIEEALSGVAKQTKKRKIVSILLSVRSKVLEGHSFARALQDYPNAFSNLYCASIQAGEESGHLADVLVELANFSERAKSNEQKLKMAMLYPAILTIVAIAIVSFLLTSVMPNIVETFQKQNTALPGVTVFMLNLSDALKQHGLGLLAFFLLTGVLYKWLMRKDALQVKRDQIMLLIPFVKEAIKTIQITRYISTLAMLSKSAVPLVDAMRIAAQVLANKVLQKKLAEACRQVKEGTALWKALEATELLPPMMLQLIINGEQSGQLDLMLSKAAYQQEEDTNGWISTLVGLFEPAMLLMMGAIVMLIVAAILLPIMDLNQLLL